MKLAGRWILSLPVLLLFSTIAVAAQWQTTEFQVFTGERPDEAGGHDARCRSTDRKE